MRILHLGGNRLGDRILKWLTSQREDVVTFAELEELMTAVREGAKADWLVSAGFRYIVPEEVLDSVQRSCNVHTSYLPWGRGAHPNVWAIVDEEPAGVTIHKMTASLDRGPVFAQRRVEVQFADVAKDLHERLEDAAFDLFVETWPMLRSGKLQSVPQPSGGSYHRTSDLAQLADVSLDDSVTWRHALNVMRALTFPPHRNLTLDVGGRRYHVEVQITDVTDAD